MLSGSQRGMVGGKEEVDVGGWMMERADWMVAGLESRPPARYPHVVSLATVIYA